MGIQIISFNCILKSKTGQLISSTFNREVLAAEQADGSMLNGLAQKLQNLSTGEKRVIKLDAIDAYGFYDPKKVILYPRNKIPKFAKVGESIQILGKSGQIRSYRILEVHDNMVSLDGNHPLAGQDLIFEIEALAVRDATAEEIADSDNTVTGQILH